MAAPTAPAAVTPAATLNVPATTMIGEAFSFTVTFDNLGAGSEVGYGPFVDLFLPIGGVDGTSAGGPNDGISFVSAQYLSTAVTSFTDTCSPGGTVTHPLIGGTVTCPALPGGFDPSSTWQFVTLELPFGSFAPDQPPAPITVNVNLSNYADLGVALPIQARGGFRYGADPLDNPNSDPPKVQSPFVEDDVTPTLIRLTKSYNGPEDETATGPNFPREYTIAVDIADGQTVTNLDITDYLPGNLQFVSVVSTNPSATCGTLPSTTTPGGTLVCTFASVTGGAGTSDATVTFSFYVPLNDANGDPVINASTGDDVSCENHAGALGDWTPLDPRDLGGTDNASAGGSGAPPEHILGCKSIAVQKSVANITDSVNSPGDVLEYTLNFQVSDFFAFQNVTLVDVLSDGQRFDSSFAPTLLVNGNSFALPAAGMSAANVNVVCNYTGGPGPECDADDPAANDGRTTITFDISAELITRGRPNGQLLGGCVPTAGGSDYDCDPFNDGPTTATLKFRAVIQDQYSDDFPSGDPSVDQGDVLNNSVTVAGDVLNNADLTPTGYNEADTSGAGVTIAQGNLEKTIYARNGTACSPQPCSNVQVTPGDTVTYRLRYTHPTSSFENFSITDFLPLPVFNATEVTGFSNTVCGVPAAGAACLGPADTYHTLAGAVTPTMATNAANNTVAFTYGNYDNPANPTSVVDLLFTVTVQAQPFADGLFLTNQARSVEGTTQTTERTVDSIVQLQVLGPVIGLRKGIVATDKATATFNPTPILPPNVTVSAPGSGCPRIGGSGLPVHSGNLGTTFNSNLSGVDAGDLVTFAIVIENTGRGPNGAFDVRVRDDLPPGFVVPSGGINLCVTDGTGALFTVTDLGGGLLGTGIELNDPGPTNPPAGGLDPGRLPDGTVITTGRNIAIITFDLQVATSAQPNQNIVNTATLFNFAAQEGGANFAGTDRTDTASTTIAVPVLSKFLVASSEAHTVEPLIIADFTGTGFSSLTGNWVTAVTTNPHFVRIGSPATGTGGSGTLNFATPLDLRGYASLGVLIRRNTDAGNTNLRVTLTDSDGTTARFDATITGLAIDAPGFSQVVLSSLLVPASGPTGGSTLGLDLSSIASLTVAGSNNSAVRWDIDRIVALRTLAAPGEIVRYRLVAQIPEGTLPDFALFDSIPPGIRFINDDTVRVAFVANGGGITSAAAGSGAAAVPALTGAGLNLTGSGDDVSSFSLAVGGPNGLAIGEGTSFDANVSSSRTTDTDTYSDNTDVWFRLGTLTNSDNDADAEYVVVEFNALVTNDRDSNAGNGSAQQAGIGLSNTFQARINSSTGNTQVGSTSTGNDFQVVIIVEPQINNLGKTITTVPVDAGDPIAYQINFSNNTAHPAQYAPQVRAATTAAFSATFNPTGGVGGTGRFTGAPATVDGVTLAEGDRVLVKDQATASQNGIYKVVDAVNGIWDRATDFDAATEMTLGYRAYVAAGTANGGRTFALDATVATINSSPVTFSAVAANPAVRVATTGNIGTGFSSNQITGVALTGGNLVIDGVTLAVGDRVLVRSQSTAAQNGVYVVTAISGTATLTRATDFDTAAEFPVGIQVYVAEGDRMAGRTFAQVSSVATLNTSNINWTVVDQVTAFDLVLTDALPPDVLFQSVTIVTPDIPAGQTFTASGVFTGGSVTVPAVNTSGTITVSLDRLDPEAKITGAVKDVTITVNGVVSGSATARQEIVNTAQLTYTGLPGPRGTANNPTGTDPTTSPSVDASGGQYGERNGSGVTATDNTPVNYATSVRNNYSVASTAIFTLARPTVDKAFKDGTLTEDDTSHPGTAGANVTIGEQVTYDILVTLPEGFTPGVVVNDVVPEGLRLDSYAVITTASGSGMLSQDFNGSLSVNPPTVAPALPVSGPNTVAFTFSNGSVTADGNPNNNAFVLRVTAMVLNAMANQNGVTRTNTATLRFDDPALPARTVPDSNPTNNPVVTVVEPVLAVAKAILSNDPAPPVVGTVTTYRITVNHAVGSASTAYDTRITDFLPTGLTLDLGSINVTLDGGASGLTNNSSGNNVDLLVASIPVGGSVVVEFQATVSSAAGLSAVNTATATWTSLPGSNPDERGSGDGLLGSGGLNDYEVRASTSPLAVTLADFAAEGTAEGVVVTWETVSEVDNVGFRVLRSEALDGERTALAFVPSAAPGGSAGVSYRYVDATARPGAVYWYWLEAVDAAGATTLHGPVSALAGPTATRRLWLPLVTR